jgi:hypothetical protein
MTISTTVPITVTAEAAARIAALGLETDVDRMIEHVRKDLPEVERIEVILYDRYELGDEPGVSIDIYSHQRFDAAAATDDRLTRWMVKEFPPRVLEHVLLDFHSAGPKTRPDLFHDDLSR